MSENVACTLARQVEVAVIGQVYRRWLVGRGLVGDPQEPGQPGQLLQVLQEALGLDGQPFVDEYNSRFTVGEDDAPLRARRAPQQRRERGPRESRIAAVALVAIALATARPFDLVLMDVQMPEMDGIAVTQALKAEC